MIHFSHLIQLGLLDEGLGYVFYMELGIAKQFVNDTIHKNNLQFIWIGFFSSPVWIDRKGNNGRPYCSHIFLRPAQYWRWYLFDGIYLFDFVGRRRELYTL